MVKLDVSLTVIVIYSDEVLEADVGDSIITIVGELSHLDIVRSISIVHGALSDIQYTMVTRVLSVVKSDISMSMLVVNLSNKILELVGINGEGLHICDFTKIN